MTLFGQEINMQMDEKQMKLAIGAGVVAAIILLVFLIVMPKITQYQEVSAELENQKNLLVTTQQTYDKELALLNQLKRIFEEQKMNLETLKQKFKDSSLRDETDLKIVVQKLINRLGLKSTEIAKSDIDDTNPSYTKVYIPYKLRGDFNKVGRLFYYLENSKWLLTFNGSELKINKVELPNKQQVIEVSFRVGAYILKGGDLVLE